MMMAMQAHFISSTRGHEGVPAIKINGHLKTEMTRDLCRCHLVDKQHAALTHFLLSRAFRSMLSTHSSLLAAWMEPDNKMTAKG